MKRYVNEKCLCSSGMLKGKDRVNSLQKFLIYFLEYKRELSLKLKKIRKPGSLYEAPELTLRKKKSEIQPFTACRFKEKGLRK